ncbi:MAG: hypothetical protein HPY69_18615 [Armatimonadetes bacterium]|nr:hypothetical protein [Armatimonadota bacterium]
MALSSGQRRHLVSAYATFGHMLRQMEEAALEGRSPTGVGSPLTPLPAEEVAAVCGPLQRLQECLREAVAELAPDELADFERAQGPHNTRVWLSNLLEKARAAIDSLHPDRMRRYGQPTDDQKQLLSLHQEMLSLMAEARAALEAQVAAEKERRRAAP